MPLIQNTVSAPASNLAAVIGQVRDAFAAIGDATPIMTGKGYLEQFGVGAAPRVLFVPEPKGGGGKVGPAIELGNPCSITHSCNVLVRGVESGDDLGRFDATYALGDRVVSLIKTAAPGRVEFGAYLDDSPASVDIAGAGLKFSFTYIRDVRNDAARWGLPAAAADTSAATPIPPIGTPYNVDTLTVTTIPEN